MKELITGAASLTIGLSLGLIGAGGSILTIPVFVYILRIDPLASSVYSMFVVGTCSAVGSLKSMMNRLVDFKVTIVFGVPSVLGVLLSRKWIFPAIPQDLFSIGGFVLSKNILFMLCISVLMFATAMRMLKSAPRLENKHANQDKNQIGLLWIQGVFVGLLSGLLGIGGGFLIVPALYFWAGVPMKTAVGTTLLIIAINSLFSFFSSYPSYLIDWNLLFKFSAGSVVGILIGTRIAENISGDSLKKIFGWMVLAISVYTVCRQLS